MSLQNIRQLRALSTRAQRLLAPTRLAVVGLLWLVSVIIGMGLLWTHSQTEGDLNLPPANWPTESALMHRPGRPTLVFFAHPRCPCTTASLRELERLLTSSLRRIDTTIVFVRPEGVGDEWMESSAMSLAREIPGAKIFIDNDGEEAERFAVATSGQICLYGREGTLQFHGGITPARGHEGDSVGHSAIRSLLTGGPAEACSPVYGCPLQSPPAAEANQ
jgi:hypothetical protein